MSPEQLAELAAALVDHPWIDAAVPEGAGLRLRPTIAATAVRPTPGPLVTEYLEHWGEVYDFTYTAADGNHAGDLDLSGWRAADTGEPFPVEHMADWVDCTVDLVRAADPRWVLELGCGTGLLAHRLRPHVTGYVGTDVAHSAVDRLVATADASSAYVVAAAHEIGSPAVRDALARAGFPPEGPDCVLVNSVAQHFPNVEYLTAVVVDAIRVLTPGGTLVVGDIRHSGLLQAHCRSIEAAADPDPATLTERSRLRADRDDELNIDPATLAVAAVGAGRPVHLSVHPKVMREDTELTHYRFDAVLQVEPPPPATSRTAQWSGLDDLLAEMESGSPVRVTGIPNRLLSGTPGAVTARELRDAVTGRDAAVLLDARDPALLAVVTPAAAAADPVQDLLDQAPTAHEPFTAFLTQRLGEIARTTLRRRAPRVQPPPITVESDPLAGAAAVADAAIDAVDAERMPAFLDDLDDVALLAMAATLAQGRSEGTAEEIADALGVAERHRWILRRWLAALTDAGMIRHDRNSYRGLRPVGRTELDEATRSIDRARRGLGYPPELTKFFQTATHYLPELLRDELALQALLFTDGETDTAEGAYRDNTVNRYVNAAAADLVRARADAVGGVVRVLELGAGVGGTTTDVLAALEGRPRDYLFTDVSRFFLVDARQRFAGVEGLRFGMFDIDGDPTGQGLAPGDRDVVLGANVLHNARDIGATLRGVRELLVPGGLLVFVETTREIRQILTSMQFLMSARPGRDRPGTGDTRAGTERIFLTAGEWTAQLAAAGLQPWGCLPRPGHPLHPIGVQVFAAVRPLG